MDLKIVWTDFAKSELQEIFHFYRDQAGLKIATQEATKIVKATIPLKKQPEMGQVEDLLKDRKIEFRYLIHQSYKIIYWINREHNRVEIVDVFHTRQYPGKLKRMK